MDVPPRAGVGIKDRNGVRRDAGAPHSSDKEPEADDERTVRTRKTPAGLQQLFGMSGEAAY